MLVTIHALYEPEVRVEDPLRGWIFASQHLIETQVLLTTIRDSFLRHLDSPLYERPTRELIRDMVLDFLTDYVTALPKCELWRESLLPSSLCSMFSMFLCSTLQAFDDSMPRCVST